MATKDNVISQLRIAAYRIKWHVRMVKGKINNYHVTQQQHQWEYLSSVYDMYVYGKWPVESRSYQL